MKNYYYLINKKWDEIKEPYRFFLFVGLMVLISVFTFGRPGSMLLIYLILILFRWGYLYGKEFFEFFKIN
jgi:hypothetical protein